MFKLPSIIFAAVMGLFMSFTITLATTIYRVGLKVDFISQGLEIWSLAYPVTVICIMVYRPLAMRATNFIAHKFGIRPH